MFLQNKSMRSFEVGDMSNWGFKRLKGYSVIGIDNKMEVSPLVIAGN